MSTKQQQVISRCEYYLYFSSFDYENRDPQEDAFEIAHNETFDRDDTEIEIEIDLSEILK